ncbi:MAG: sulfite exporter TauE/SafE family protein [bacterium]
MIIIIIIFTATFVQSTFGFGSALIMMPFLTALTGIKTAVPLAALVATTIHITILIHKWRELDLRAAWRLIVASLAGIPLGAFILRLGNEVYLKCILGLIIVIFSLYYLLKPALPLLKNEKYAYVFGFFAGILGGAYNTNGPPVVIYGTMRRWNPRVFRTTMQGYFFPTGLLLLFSHYSVGLWTDTVWHNYLIAFPFVLAAVWAGARLNAKISSGKFDKYIYIFLVLTGISLAIHAVTQLIY